MKKVLSLVLVLTLVLGSFSMAFAAETTETNLSDIDGNANEAAIVVANDLGIVTGYNDGTFKPDNAVTRAEFAAMMTRALAIPESALKGFKASSFKDVTSDHWAVAYLGYCNSKGIMTGYEDGTARPNQTITVNEAITMICRALGYTNQAKELVGSWPANYIALAQNLKLYKDVQASATTDRASAAQIIYNALPITLQYINADGDTMPQSGNPSMLSMLGGELVNNGNAFVLGADAAAGPTNNLNLAKAIVNITPYIGSYVKAWLDEDGYVIAIEECSDTVTGTFDGTDTITINDVDYTIKRFGYALGNANIVTNGDVTSVHDATPVATSGIAADDTVTLTADISGKTITDVYSIMVWNRNAVGQFKANKLDLEKATIDINGSWEFDTDDNGDVDYTTFTLLGVTSLEKIAEDNVVEIYMDSANRYVKKIAVGTKTVKGEITKVNADNDAFWIDGVKYSQANGGDTPDLGDTGTAYLNYDGDLMYWDADDATAGNYAIFLGAGTETNVTGTTSTTKAELVTKDGESDIYDLASGKTVDYTALVTSTAVAPLANGILCKYSFNSSKKINVNVEAAATQVSTVGAPASVNASYTTYDGVPFATSVVVFMYNATDDEWTIGSLKDLKTKDGNSNDFEAIYVKNAKGKIEAIAVVKGDAVSTDSSWGLINSATGQKNSAKDDMWYVDGVMDGKALAAFTDDAYVKGASYDFVSLNPKTAGEVGLYQFTLDASGVVTKILTAGGILTGANIIEDDIVSDVGTTTIDLSGAAITIDVAKDAVVYFYNKDGDYEVSSLAKIADGNGISVFSTSDDNQKHGIYDIIVFWKR